MGQVSVIVKNDNCSPKPLQGAVPTISICVAGKRSGLLRTVSFCAQSAIQAIRSKPDLILTTHANFAPFAAILKRLIGVPYWTVCHGIDVWDIKSPSRLAALRSSDKLLCVSGFTLNKVQSQLFSSASPSETSPSKLVWFPNTFDSVRFKPSLKPKYLSERYGLDRNSNVILTLGRLSASEAYKGYDKILEALPAIRKALPNVRYILGGKGDDRERIERIVSEKNLGDCVTLAGFIPEEELVDHYNLCDLFAMPSKGEGFGIVYLEALGCGKPVLAGNKDGSVDALNGGEFGALVDPDNVAEIANACTQILNGAYPNPLIYKPDNLRQKVIDLYGFEQFKNRLSNLLSPVQSLT